MKMRLERAFLLDELRKRMDVNVEGSEASADEGMATPPPDRPHRDKRRRPNHVSSHAHSTLPTSQPSFAAAPTSRNSDPHAAAGTPLATAPGGQPGAANTVTEDSRYTFVDNSGLPPSQPSVLSQGSPYGLPPGGPGKTPSHSNGLNGVDEREGVAISRQSGAVGEAMGVGPAIVEENGERKVLPSAAESADIAGQQQGRARSGFNAVNN